MAQTQSYPYPKPANPSLSSPSRTDYSALQARAHEGELPVLSHLFDLIPKTCWLQFWRFLQSTVFPLDYGHNFLSDVLAPVLCASSLFPHGWQSDLTLPTQLLWTFQQFPVTSRIRTLITISFSWLLQPRNLLVTLPLHPQDTRQSQKHTYSTPIKLTFTP